MNGTAAPGRFTMSSEAEHLGRLRQWLRGALAGLGVDRATGSELLLAVGELCANSIEHAYEGRGGQSIEVSVRGYDDRVEIEVEDWGKTFDASRYVEPDLESLPEHGMGIHLVRRIADSLAVDVQRERGTRWTLTKYRRAASPAVGFIDDRAPVRPGETMDIEVTKSGTISTPTTLPVGPVRYASRAVVHAEPEPTSSTRCPGRTSRILSMLATVRGCEFVCP